MCETKLKLRRVHSFEETCHLMLNSVPVWLSDEAWESIYREHITLRRGDSWYILSSSISGITRIGRLAPHDRVVLEVRYGSLLVEE